ncbi:uncharacterized protein L3040_000501 [Drepanopeziza brunnea f. sp. 'multigermtubi']|uniref:uncharacterized protein n=1 Tax=Drepanopeziza brunnea f. sp. 'multigermtubi' TaxID=698441 RepID=UPI0023903268|nr:hypothetical protein L3040_000501 [Drepanopeziza brunnea f. sp. 'multigermtubi']
MLRNPALRLSPPSPSLRRHTGSTRGLARGGRMGGISGSMSGGTGGGIGFNSTAQRTQDSGFDGHTYGDSTRGLARGGRMGGISGSMSGGTGGGMGFDYTAQRVQDSGFDKYTTTYDDSTRRLARGDRMGGTSGGMGFNSTAQHTQDSGFDGHTYGDSTRELARGGKMGSISGSMSGGTSGSMGFDYTAQRVQDSGFVEGSYGSIRRPPQGSISSLLPNRRIGFAAESEAFQRSLGGLGSSNMRSKPTVLIPYTLPPLNVLNTDNTSSFEEVPSTLPPSYQPQRDNNQEEDSEDDELPLPSSSPLMKGRRGRPRKPAVRIPSELQLRRGRPRKQISSPSLPQSSSITRNQMFSSDSGSDLEVTGHRSNALGQGRETREARRIQANIERENRIQRKDERKAAEEAAWAEQERRRTFQFQGSIPLSDLSQPYATPAEYKPAVSRKEWKMIQDFHSTMGAIQMDLCSRCNERWFEMRLKVVRGDLICHECNRRDRFIKEPDLPGQPYLMTAGNNMDPGEVPDYLPKLSALEEALISPLHVNMSLWRHRGHQYKYSGHVVTFASNNAKFFENLPLLPEEVNVIILKPKGTDEDPRISRQFKKECRVRRFAIHIWLTFLKANNPEYIDINIDWDLVDSLPVDEDMRERVTTIEDETPEQPLPGTAAPAATESSAQKRRRLRREARGNLEENSSEDEALADDENALPDVGDHLDPDDDLPDDQERPPLETTVPDLNPDTTESNQLLAQVNKLASKQHVFASAPSQRSTPISELKPNQKLFSLAFPTLFPTGAGDFHTQRFRKVAKVSSYFVKSRKDIKDLGIDGLRDQLEEQPALLNQIVRCGQAIDGTRPFWKKQGYQLEALAKSQPNATAAFLTWSVADMQWEDLQRHLPRYDEYKAANQAERAKIVWVNVQENPAIIAHYIYIRWQAFLQDILGHYLPYTDFWARWEWQDRGSGHITVYFGWRADRTMRASLDLV